MSEQNCYWVFADSYTFCSDAVHHNGEALDDNGGPCKADFGSQLVVVSLLQCESIAEPPAPGSNPTMPGDTGGGSSGTGSGTGTNPNPCIQIPTDPNDPSTGIGDDGCTVGIPTIPNVGTTKTPCQKIKEQRLDDEYAKRQDTLQGNTGLKKETGYIQKWGGTYEYKSNAGSNSEANTLSLPPVATNTYIKGFNHTHVDDYDFTDPSDGLVKTKIGIKIPSPADVGYFMDLVQNAQTFNHPLDDVYGGMISSGNNYQIRFTGNQYQIKTFTDEQTEAHREPYRDFMKDFIDKPKKLELGFLWYISEKMNLKGVTLYRLNADGTTTEIKLNATKTDTVETTCPN